MAATHVAVVNKMIVKNDPESLRKPCLDVFPEEVDSLRKLLEVELEQSGKDGYPGIGLAAAQINVQKKFAIVRISPELSVDLVNCYIEKGYDEFTFSGEGCLSFPDLISDTKRFSEIYVKGNLVAPHEFVATGLFAVAIQHELDHLNGVILADRAIKVKPSINIGPNDPCYCGKLDIITNKPKKYKKCCGR